MHFAGKNSNNEDQRTLEAVPLNINFDFSDCCYQRQVEYISRMCAKTEFLN